METGRLDHGRQEQNLTRDVRFRVDRNDRRALGARAAGEIWRLESFS